MPEPDAGPTVTIVTTEALDPDRRAAIIAVCNAANATDEFHKLFGYIPSGGTHAVVSMGSEVVSHAVAQTRWLQVDDDPILRTAYIDAVATHPAHQGRGYSSAALRMLATAIEEYDVGCLQTDITPFYERLGWEAWRGPLAGRDGGTLVPTPDQRGVMVLRLPTTPPLDLDARLSIERQPDRIWE